MSRCNFNNKNLNNNHNRRPQSDSFYHSIMMLFTVLNGLAVGGTIRNGIDMVKNGYESDNMMELVAYLMCAIYTGRCAYRVYRHKQELDNNQKQR